MKGRLLGDGGGAALYLPASRLSLPGRATRQVRVMLLLVTCVGAGAVRIG